MTGVLLSFDELDGILVEVVMSDALSELRRELAGDPGNKSVLLRVAQEFMRLDRQDEAYGTLFRHGGLNLSTELTESLKASIVERQNKALMSLQYPEERFSAGLRAESPPPTYWGPDEFSSEVHQWVWEDLGEFIAHPRPILALDLRVLSLEVPDLQTLPNLLTLQSLSLSSNPHIEDPIFEILKELPMLSILDLSDCNSLTEDGLMKLPDLKGLQSLRLDFLHLGDELCKAISEITSLRYLHLGWCSLSLEGITCFAQLPHLSEISMSLTNLDLKEVRQRLPNIRILPNDAS